MNISFDMKFTIIFSFEFLKLCVTFMLLKKKKKSKPQNTIYINVFVSVTLIYINNKIVTIK